MDSEERSNDITAVRIRVREVLSESGVLTSTESVCCPALERSTSLRACRVCGHSQGISEGPGEPNVFCDHVRSVERAAQHAAPVAPHAPDHTPISELMTTHVVCVRPEVGLEALSQLLLERKIDAVPVVDGRGAPIGVVSTPELMRYWYEHRDTGSLETPRAEATVADVMVPIAMARSEEATVSYVAATMAHERTQALPIVTQDGTVVGTVSTLEIVRWYARQQGYLVGSND